MPLSSKNRLVTILVQMGGYFMKCCCCGNNFRGLIKKEGTKVSEEGICPACKLLTNPAIHGSIDIGSIDEGKSLLPPFVER